MGPNHGGKAGCGLSNMPGKGKACLVGTGAAFAFNDSGVLAAAGCSVFLWSWLALRFEAARGEGTARRLSGKAP